MQIDIASGIGSGPTELAAFDAALLTAGIANFNIVVLSSVIPGGSKVVVSNDPIEPTGQWGDRLYVVMAQERVSARNAEAWAGLGWVQDADSGRGLFVEHHGGSQAEVERDIADSLAALSHNRQETFGPVEMKLAGTTCGDGAACALVAATYQASDWP
jgi:arginine decarboxylase